jgi:FkbM family methyltransferase
MNSTGPAAGEAAIVATVAGVHVPAAPHLGPGTIRAMAEGRYEARELRAALAAIRAGERVLELGAGSGLVGAAIAMNTGAAEVRSFEANPELIPHIRALYGANGLTGRIRVTHAVVLAEPDAPPRVTFHVRGNFLGSGLVITKGHARARAVEVPVVRYADLARDWPHDVIVMDIEGAERAFLEHAELAGVRLVVAELHRGQYGREGMKACRAALARAGLRPIEALCKGGVIAWAREGA